MFSFGVCSDGGSEKHIPFRDSELTKLLQQSERVMRECYGAEYCSLHVRVSNRAALTLYQATLGFKIHETDRYDFVLEILNIKNKALRHAMTSLISVLSSTLKGVEYLSHNNSDCILQRIIKVG